MANVTNFELFEVLRSVAVSKGHSKSGQHGKCGHGTHHHGEHSHDGHHHSEHAHGANGCGCKARRAALAAEAGVEISTQGKDSAKGGKCRKGRESSRNRILVALLNQPDGAKQKDLVEMLGIQAASVSEQVDILAAHGYVIKTMDDADKRVSIVTLTDKGQVKAEDAKKEQDAKLEDLFNDLTSEEKDQLFTLLNKIKK